MLLPKWMPSAAIDLLDQFAAAPSLEDRRAVIERFKDSRPHQRPVMPPFDWRPRKSLTELRPRHLHMVEEYGIADTYDRDALGDYFFAHWYRLFGPLRKSKAREVPSDQLRKQLMTERLLDLIEMRRDEYAAEKVARSF